MDHQRHPPANDHSMAATNTGSSGKWWSMLSLRLLSIIFSIVAVGFSVFYFTNWTVGPLIMMGPPAIAAFLWSCVVGICLCVRSDPCGVHAAACLIIDLLLFLALAAMSGVIAFTLSKLDDSGYYFAFFQDAEGEEYLRIVLAFGILATITHLVIAIIACFGVRGRQSKTPQIVYVHVSDPSQTAAWSNEAPPAYSLASASHANDHQVEDQLQMNDLSREDMSVGSKKAKRPF